MIAGFFSCVMALLTQSKGIGYSKGVIKDHIQPFPHDTDASPLEEKKVLYGNSPKTNIYFTLQHIML
jgi:hypothetical protein